MFIRVSPPRVRIIEIGDLVPPYLEKHVKPLIMRLMPLRSCYAGSHTPTEILIRVKETKVAPICYVAER